MSYLLANAGQDSANRWMNVVRQGKLPRSPVVIALIVLCDFLESV
jgi:hypothetical protein